MFAIASAQLSDLKAVRLLLKECALPFDDLSADHLKHFIIVRHDESPVVACIGIEAYGQDALLRSLAVYDFMRGDGWGQKLVKAAEEHARRAGIASLYLLTTTAASFFERLGYQCIERAGAPASMQTTTQFSTLCPASSTCLFKSISSTTYQREIP